MENFTKIPRWIIVLGGFLAFLAMAAGADLFILSTGCYTPVQAQTYRYDPQNMPEVKSLPLKVSKELPEGYKPQIKILTGEELAGILEERDREIQAQREQMKAFVSAPWVGNDFGPSIAYYQSINSDTRGWVRVPNTNINYPVFWSDDNQYYVDRGIYREESFYGVIYADQYTRFGNRTQISANTVLYGHNWGNVAPEPRACAPGDIMFSQLMSFHYLWFAQQTPVIYYSTADEDMVFRVFAAFYTETAFDYIASNPSPGYLQGIIDEARLRSLHQYDVDVNSDDKILTLSTCTRRYGDRADQRFVVMARLLRPGEGMEMTSVFDNPGHKEPVFY